MYRLRKLFCLSYARRGMGTDASSRTMVTQMEQKSSKPLGIHTRRRMISRAVTGFLAVWATAANAAQDTTYDIRAKQPAGSIQRVQAVVEVRGDLLIEAEETGTQKLPFVVAGKAAYDERILEVDNSGKPRRAVRQYGEATAEIKVGQTAATPRLNPERRLMVAQLDDARATLFSPLGPLSRDDLELVDIQGNTLAMGGLLPDKPVGVAQTWEPNRELLATVLGLDTITHHDVSGRLEPPDGTTAIVTLQGSLDGAVGGVATKIELKAKMNFDLTRRVVTWLAANFHERREIGHAEPGFEATARLRVAISPQQTADELSDRALRDLVLTATAGSTLLEFKPQKSLVRFVHDRRWRVISDRPDLCVLRCVDGGDLLAQCNLSELGDAEPGQRLTLEAFQAEALRSLVSSAGQVAEASQGESEPQGLRVLRVQATGIASEVPIVWIFYHLSNDQGRQASISFTMGADAVERFAGGDRALVESFEFLPRARTESAHRTEPRVRS